MAVELKEKFLLDSECDKGFAKLDIALAKGKKVHDKRETIKDRDNKRNLDRIKKNF